MALPVLSPLHPVPRKIAKPKYDDLMKLLQFVPPCHHDYFKSLSHMGTTADHDIVDPSIEDEENDGEDEQS